MSALHRLAKAAGLQIEWEDANGQQQTVSDASVRQVLAALGHPAEDEKEIATGLEACSAEAEECPFLSADQGRALHLPSGLSSASEAELIAEDGSSHAVPVERSTEGLRIAGIERTGYHRLVVDGREIPLAIAPPRCFGPGDAAPGRRLWGPAVQIPALRDGQARAFGDFGSLRDAAARFSAAGADAVAISPSHALFPADASRFSPYAPSSRLFHNVLLADPALIDRPLPATEAGELIDWEHAIPTRMEALRQAFANRREQTSPAVSAYRERGGTELLRHAIYDALHGHFFATGATGWQDWPAEYCDPSSDAVARFAAEHAEEVEFFIFAQWLAEESLARAQKTARDGGMAIGLISDLAVGMDGGGSHGWSRPGDLLNGLSIGAPPDLLGPEGQDWGITGFSPAALKRTRFEPFIGTIRAALKNAGGIRIDHALGLNRLWVIPHGAPSSEGAYLTFPLQHMLRILAIESHRARAIVIGEDLGTVPPGLRPQFEERGILGMRVLWFERQRGGGFAPPESWDAQAVAMTGTHDLPTVAGWWRGRDIDWNWKLGRTPPGASEQEDRATRDRERRDLWQAFVASGAASGPIPEPDESDEVADAALVHVGSTPCALTIFPLEDVAALVEQPNLPGTTDQHPNWRRRMPETTEDLLARPAVSRRLAKLPKARA